MQFRLVAVLLFLFSLPAVAAAQVQTLGWTPARSALWSSLMTSDSGGWWSRLQTGSIYPDQGLRSAMLYQLTGDPAHASAAFAPYTGYCGAGQTMGCSDCTGNCSRDSFVVGALVFGMVAEALPPGEQAEFKAILTQWTQQAFCEVGQSLNGQGVRVTDTDELLGNYFGLVLFALTLELEDPQLSAEILGHGPVQSTWNGCDATLAVGGVDATASNTSSTMRNAIRHYLENAGGEWPESSFYNNNSIGVYLAMAVEAINTHYGEDKFPEFDAQLFMKVALALVTPDVEDRAKWGDTQGEPRGLFPYSYSRFAGALSYLSKDPEGLWLFDEVMDKHGPGTIPESVFWWVDTEAQRDEPMGPKGFAQGEGIMGWVTHRSGWQASDSLFSSHMSRAAKVDHESKVQNNFNLYRNGAWAISNPRGYYGGNYDEEGYCNTVWLGGINSKMREAEGQSAYQVGPCYVYQSGLTAGNQAPDRSDAPPREWVHEYQRSLLHLRNGDGSDSLLVWERVLTCDWLHNTDCQDPWRIAKLDNLPELRGCGQLYSGGCSPQADGKHKWLIHPRTATVVSPLDPDLRSWLVPETQETVFWKTFVDGYSIDESPTEDLYQQGAPYFIGGNLIPSEQESHYTLFLIPDQIAGFQTWMNGFHVGGDFHMFQVGSEAGPEVVKGVRLVASDEHTLVLFNATENTPPAPSTVNGTNCNGAEGYCVNYNPERFEQTLELRYFQVGFELEIDLVEPTRLFVSDLDPDLSWVATLNGIPLPGFEASDQGVALVELAATGGLAQLRITPEIGAAFCGQGVVACPCGSGTLLDAGCENSSGVGAGLEGSGSTSLGAADLMLHGHGLTGAAVLVLATDAGTPVLLGDGALCISGDTDRLGVRNPNAAGEATWGPGLQPALSVLPGQTMFLQAWYRDVTSTCVDGSNFTSGRTITWTP